MKNKIVFFLSFFISKASVFIAPLLLSQTMSSSYYGKVEYALGGLGFLINSLIGFGIPASTGYFLLTVKDKGTKIGYNLYLLLLIFYIVGIQILYPILPEQIYLSLIISYILANQTYFSYIFKSQNKSIYATFIDAGIYFLFILLIINSYLFEINLDVTNFVLPLLLYSTIYIIIGLKSNYKLNWRKSAVQLKKISKYSILLLVSSFLVILLLNSGRFILEFFSEDFETIAIFGFYLRVSGISLILFQMLFILFYKNMYTKNYEYLDKAFALFMIVILMYSLVSIYILPPILLELSTFFKDTYFEYPEMLITLTFFSFYWTVCNIFSNIFIREGIVKIFNYSLLIIAILYIILLLSVNNLSVTQFAIIQLLIGVVIVASQQVILIKKGLVFKNSIIVITLATLIFTIFLVTNLI